MATLNRAGALGPHGFWDALDYTRPLPGESFALVQTVMAHHGGMTIVALANLLHEGIWRRRFHREPMVRATELLLQERLPRRLVVQEPRGLHIEDPPRETATRTPMVRRVDRPETAEPVVALLGDPPYSVMVTHAGGGFSRYRDLAVTRWRADATTDDTGQFCYVHDLAASRTWSGGHQPTGAPADRYHAELGADRVTLVRRDGLVETRTEIAVVVPDAAEVRRVTVTNLGRERREFELTSYAEVVMAPHETDAAHPAFAKLFIETEPTPPRSFTTMECGSEVT
jgi:cyclic beta-1,2-glucan synthetase